MRPAEFWDLTLQAFNYHRPDYGCMLVEEVGGRCCYEIWFIDYDVKISLPMPRDLVLMHQIMKKQELSTKAWRANLADVLVYALAKFDLLPLPVRSFLTSRYGLYLQDVRIYAEEAWRETERFSVKSWSGSG